MHEDWTDSRIPFFPGRDGTVSETSNCDCKPFESDVPEDKDLEHPVSIKARRKHERGFAMKTRDHARKTYLKSALNPKQAGFRLARKP